MKYLKVLIGCEFSGIVREAFRKQGHFAWSCDLLPSEIPGDHIQGDIFTVINDGWDLAIFHPPCTYLTVAANRWMKPEYKHLYPTREQDRKDAIDFFMQLANAPIPRIAIENPVGIMSTIYRKPDQIIQPFQFGHPESKKTCLWLKNLPKLVPTNIVAPEYYTLPDGTIYKDSGVARYSPTYYRTGVGRYRNQTPSGQNKLGPSDERWKIRSRTYSGIAEAFANQWSSFV